MAKVLLQISENNPDVTIDLDESRQYIVPRLVNIFKTYDTGEEVVERVYYPIKRCSDSYFKKTFEKEYQELVKANNIHQFCAEDDGIILEGVRDCAVKREKHSYVIYEINKCTDEVRESVGQETPCASEDEIDAWL